MAFPTRIVAAAGYVPDRAGRVLLIKTQHRGYDCTGGQIEAGESVEQGVLREILEESGGVARVRALVGVYSVVSQGVYDDGTTPVPAKVVFGFLCG